ncbi:MAG: type I secretion system permease/ATPase [Pseudomonadota bacterium]
MPSGPEKPTVIVSADGNLERRTDGTTLAQNHLGTWGFEGAPADPLAVVLAEGLRRVGHDIDPQNLVSGIALPADGRLTPAKAIEAADMHGHIVKLVRTRLSDVRSSALPAVLFLEGRDVCLLTKMADGNAEVLWPSRSSEQIRVPSSEVETAYTGHVLVLSSSGARPSRENDAADTGSHWFWGSAFAHWDDYAQVILASAIVNVLALATPLFTMNVYDRVFPNAAIITLWSLVAGVGLALVLDALLKWLRARIVDRVSRRVDLASSSRLFRHMANLKLSSLSSSSGSLLNALKDFEQVRDVFSSQTLATLTDLLFSGLFIAVIAYIAGPLAWPPAIALGLVVLTGIVLLLPLRSASNAARNTGSAKSAVAVEAVSELETLKAVSGHSRMQSRWEAEVIGNAGAQERSRGLATFATTLTALAQQVSSVGIVVLGVYLALDGQITMGAVIAAMILSGRALAPTAALAGLFVRGSFAIETLRNLNGIMALPSDAATRGAQHMNARIEAGALEMRSVSLSYPDAALPSLSAVSVTIDAGERVGVIGPVGAGKTSLARIFSGLYPPDEGLVLIDGINADQISPAQLRADIQLVTQDAILFTGTLAENIAFGCPGARDEEIVHAARLAGVDRIAAAHPEGFAMPIAERGRSLSGGQRQLVALSRALISKPKVLILDEPTSSMDAQSEKRFIERLKVALAERPMTVIVSTHRMGLLDLTDRVIQLNNGRVERDGPKDAVFAALSGGPK